MADNPTPDRVWVAVSSTGDISAHETRHSAENALRDDEGDVWIEEVEIQATEQLSERSHSPEHGHPGTDTHPARDNSAMRRSWIAPPSVSFPTGELIYNPWGSDGPEAA